MYFAITLVVLALLLAIVWKFLGDYIYGVYTGKINFLFRIEKIIYQLLGVDRDASQTWQRYAASLVVFSFVSLVFCYVLLRVQNFLPLNPQHLPGVGPYLSFNTAVSFVTNTNWQNYAGETTMSYFSQMVNLATEQFISPVVGLAVAIALIRAIAANQSKLIGNFWVDLVKGILYIFLPISLIFAVIFIWQGAVETLSGPVKIIHSLSGQKQTILLGPIASMEVIKELGTNGGGYFSANGSYPFENPTPLTNFLSVFLMLSIPFSLTYVFGKWVKNLKQGIVLLVTMVILFVIAVFGAVSAESHGNAAVSSAHISQPHGNMEGKEVRFGDKNSVLYNIASTQTSTGSVDSSNDSYSSLGGFWLLEGMELGEISPGGVGSGLYTIILFALLTVFVGGLMVGRTPEYLGKKIQAKEVKLASLAILVMPIFSLVLTGIAVMVPSGKDAILNKGPHGFSEILYAYVSQANNNGSAFAGLSSNNAFYNITGAIAMLAGRYFIILPTLALAGELAQKGFVPVNTGTFKTDTPLFVVLLIGVIVIVGGLTFFPAMALGPIAEHLLGKRFF